MLLGFRVFLGSGLCAVFVAFIGCNPPRTEIEGAVRFNGAPIETGSIQFEPADGQGREFGGVIDKGRYKIAVPPNVSSGSKVVRIRASIKSGAKIEAGSPHPPGTMVDEVVPLPAEFNDKSGLTATFENGKMTPTDFELSNKN